MRGLHHVWNIVSRCQHLDATETCCGMRGFQASPFGRMHSCLELRCPEPWHASAAHSRGGRDLTICTSALREGRDVSAQECTFGKAALEAQPRLGGSHPWLQRLSAARPA